MKKSFRLFEKSAFAKQEQSSNFVESSLREAEMESEAYAIMDSGLFDCSFYQGQCEQPFADAEQMILHYLANGGAAKLQPHPLFDTEFYLAQLHKADTPAFNPLIHFLQTGWKIGLNPHPLFDVKFYLENNIDVREAGVNPLVHYLKSGAFEGRDPSSLFKSKIYGNLFHLLPGKVDALLHFVREIAPSTNDFTQAFLNRSAMRLELSLKGNAQIALFKSLPNIQRSYGVLMREKFGDLLKVSSLFDTVFVTEQLREHQSAGNIPLSICYEDFDWIIELYFEHWHQLKLKPHLAFDTDYYVTNSPELDFDKIEPLTHYLTAGWKDGKNPHPLFDTTYYLEMNKDVAKARLNPFEHFIERTEVREFSPFFDNFHYISSMRRFNLRRTIAALKKSGKRIWFRNAFLESLFQRPSASLNVNVLLEFLGQDQLPNILPTSNFSMLFDVQLANQGLSKNRKFVRVLPKVDLRFSKELTYFINCLRLRKGTTGFLSDANTVYLCGHEASRTGAPLLMLRLAQELANNGKNCVVILRRGGELENEFRSYAHVINLAVPEHLQLGTDSCLSVLTALFDSLKIVPPDYCILNSAETSGFAPAFKKFGVQTVLLVHEVLDSYQQSFLKAGFAHCDLKIFPAPAILTFAQKKTGDTLEGSCILPTAILNSHFSEFDKVRARENLRREINAESESLIILSCGSPDMRKGLDVFYHTARCLLSQLDLDVHFVWVGGSKRLVAHTVEYWVDWDIRSAGLGSKIHILPARPDLRTPFHGSDIFYMPSRQDPFPCVVHDAMAAHLPVVAFRDSGGVPDMLAQGASKLVEYGDIASAAKALIAYVNDQQLRSKHADINFALMKNQYSFESYTEDLMSTIGNFLLKTKSNTRDEDLLLL